nr:hypothetical protein [Tanacetum cinerariifolium]
FPKKLEQPFLLGGREGVPDYYGLAYEYFEGWDAGREYIFPRGCDNTEHTSYPNPETTRSTTLLSRVEPQILPGRRVNWARRPGSYGPRGAASRERDYHVNCSRGRPSGKGCCHGSPCGKSLAAIELGMGSTRPIPTPQDAPVDVSDPDPLSFADPQSRPSADVTQSFKGAAAVEDPESENTSFASMNESPESIYRPEWGITNGCLLDVPEA